MRNVLVLWSLSCIFDQGGAWIHIFKDNTTVIRSVKDSETKNEDP